MESTPIPPETPVENDNTVVFKRSHFYSVMVVFAFAAGILVGYMAWGRGDASAKTAAVPVQVSAQQAAAAEEEAPSAPTRYNIPTDGYPSLGPDDAEIVIVEFSDYQ